MIFIEFKHEILYTEYQYVYQQFMVSLPVVVEKYRFFRYRFQMINPVLILRVVSPIILKHAEHVVNNIYPEIKHDYFNESTQYIYKKYISGITRGVAELKQEEFVNEKARRLFLYEELCIPVCPEAFEPISRNEASYYKTGRKLANSYIRENANGAVFL